MVVVVRASVGGLVEIPSGSPLPRQLTGIGVEPELLLPQPSHRNTAAGAELKATRLTGGTAHGGNGTSESRGNRRKASRFVHQASGAVDGDHRRRAGRH